MRRAAVIPTRDRPEDWADCVAAIAPQVDVVVTVTHGLEAWGYAARSEAALSAIAHWGSGPANISAMWNHGLDAATALLGTGDFLCAFLNDDAVVPEGWFDRLAAAMADSGSAGASGARGEGRAGDRISGYAFVLDHASGVRADESLHWWYGDDDIQKQCERAGGFHVVRGLEVEHRHPNETTKASKALTAQTERDLATFATKWRGTK